MKCKSIDITLQKHSFYVLITMLLQCNIYAFTAQYHSYCKMIALMSPFCSIFPLPGNGAIMGNVRMLIITYPLISAPDIRIIPFETIGIVFHRECIYHCVVVSLHY